MCPGCKERDERIAALERRLAEALKRIAALEERLKTNSSNSSLPPSANPLGQRPPVVKPKSKKKRGAQPGHPPHLKQLLPPERITQIEAIVPTSARIVVNLCPRRY